MKMIPTYLDNTVKSWAEKRLFKIFDKVNEGEGYFCLHSLNLPEHEYKILGELDFVVVSPYGIFVLEVKGGGISCVDGIWYFEDRWGVKHKSSEGPFHQVRSGMFSLRSRMQERLPEYELNNFVMGYGVVFPDCDFEVEGLEWDDALIMDSTHIVKNRVSEYFDRLEKYWHGKFPERRSRVQDSAVERVLQVLRPKFDLAKSLHVQAEEIEAMHINLTDEQYSRLDIIEENERILIKGGAGTGKTVLALEEAKRQVAEGKRVLLVCFSPILARFLKKRDDDAGISIYSVHELMLNLVQKYSEIPSGYSPGMSITDPWFMNRLTKEFEKASIYITDADMFDTLIIDEGQDILNLEYMAALDHILRGGLAEGRWRIFFDPNNQSAIFSSMNFNIIDLLKSYSLVITKLSINCRNTKPIITHTELYTGAEMARKMAGEGPIVDVEFYENKNHAAELLEEFLRNLVIENDIKENTISILSPVSWENSAASCLSPGWKRRIRILEGSREDVFPYQEVTFSTIADFKGLENSIIALIDIEDMDSTEKARANLYVGMTRARVKLWVAIHKTLYNRHNEIIVENLKMEGKG